MSKLNNKISRKSILLILYLAIIFITSILFIPSFAVWGPEKYISGYNYVFLFNLIVDREGVNGSPIFYQIDYLRILYTIGVSTLIFLGIWKLFTLWDKEDMKDERE